MVTNTRQPGPEPKAEEVRKKKLKRPKPPSMGQPPLVPLIDIFLFLIVFFLLSCQFHQAEGTIPANLPSTLTGLNQGEAKVRLDPIRITLEPIEGDALNVRIYVGDSGRTLEGMMGLFTYFQEARAHYGEAQCELLPIIIKPMIGIRWGFVVDAFNQAVRAGFKEVGVAPSGGVSSLAGR